MIQNKYSHFLFTLFLFFIAIIYISFIQENYINRDGVGYLIQANLIHLNQSDLAKTLYPNLGFAHLILFIKNLFGFSFANAATLLNLFFLSGSLTFFILILNEINKDYRLKVMGLLTIAASIPVMDLYLAMVVRDHGFWCFGLAGIFALIRWLKNQSIFWILVFTLAFTIASFFRLEASLFIIFSPVMMYWVFYKQASSRVNLFFLQYVLIAIVGIATLGIYFYTTDQIELGRYVDLFQRPIDALYNILKPLPIHSSDIWLNTLIEDFPQSNKFLLFGNAFLQKWIFGLSIPYFLLLILGIKYIDKNNSQALLIKKILTTLAIFSGLIVFANLLATYVISGRYFVLHFWILYIFVSYGLYVLFFDKELSKQLGRVSIFRKVAIVLLAIMIANGLFDKTKHSIEKNTAQWLLDEKIPFDQVYVQDLRVRYYMNQLTVEDNNLKEAVQKSTYQYFVLSTSDNLSLMNQYRVRVIMQLPSSTNPKLIVYQRND
jgi:hypothetical protein